MSKVKRLFSKDGFWLSVHYLFYKTRLKYMLSDELFTRLQYRAHFGSHLNLKKPITYNEKLNWLKLHDHNPLYTTLVDKAIVKDYVARIIGKQYVIPTYGVWETFDDIDFDLLPNEFVLKTNHSGGNSGVVICKDKSTFDKNRAKQKLEESLKTDVYKISREWPYRDVKRVILAEQYMEDKQTNELRDYKFFCFNGEPKALFVATGRQKCKEPCFDFFDMEYNHLDLKCDHPLADKIPSKPSTFEEMKEVARKLSKGLKHVRVDLYEINGEVFFGELTLYHWQGQMKFYPNSWNYIWGEWLNLEN